MQTILACLMLTVVGMQAEPADKTATDAAPLLVCDQTTVDLGKLVEGEIGEASFTLRNDGNAPLVIERVRTSCGCTTVKLSEEQKKIEPGATLELPVKFNSSRRHGKQKKIIRIFSNDPKNPEFRLTLESFVETLINIHPGPTLNMRSIKRGETCETPVEILPGAGETELKIQSITVESDDLSFTQEPLEKDGVKGIKLIFTVDEDARLGTLSVNVNVLAKCGEREGKTMFRIAAQISGDIACTPENGVMSIRSTTRGTKLRSITLTPQKGVSFNVLGVDAGPWLDYKIIPVGNRHRIDLQVNNNAPDGPIAQMVYIKTNNYTQPVIEMPVFVNVAPRIAATPSVVYLNMKDPISQKGRSIKVATSRSTPFKITNITVDNPAITAEVVTPNPELPAVKGTVLIKVADSIDVDELQANVTIETDVPNTEPISVSVTAVNPG